MRRQGQGAYANLVKELNAEEPEQFRQYHRIDRQSFESILTMVNPLIVKQDTQMRFSISPRERLTVTIRFLATGESFRSLAFQFRMGERTISGIIEETCLALYGTMKGNFLKTPSSVADWLVVSKEFEEKWNYPSCIGAIDGKHIAIQNPNDSGSEFYNYKHFYSVLLLAVVDANYKFIYVDAGAAGRAGDAGLFNASVLKRTLDDGSLNLPPPACVEGIPEALINYHMVGDDAFALTRNMMKPYPHRHMDKPKRIFNYRLSRARRVVENAFGILASRFRVFLTTIKLSPQRVTYLILASCCLHNFMVDNNKHAYTSAGDVESGDHTFLSGAWRADPPLNRLQSCTTDRNPTRSAKQQHQLLTSYFSGAGAVTWQDNMI
ncbi:Hypothetical predicted protein [Paramuricea clavata]|uniref:Uncharacterized protein n=1 Tax=Paramuricea clavata TaxID=317549 RepID=A0A7D9IR85_PARCT|nr:Hypothetical predicted protein [Paramuricea clavata]